MTGRVTHVTPALPASREPWATEPNVNVSSLAMQLCQARDRAASPRIKLDSGTQG